MGRIIEVIETFHRYWILLKAVYGNIRRHFCVILCKNYKIVILNNINFKTNINYTIYDEYLILTLIVKKMTVCLEYFTLIIVFGS